MYAKVKNSGILIFYLTYIAILQNFNLTRYKQTNTQKNSVKLFNIAVPLQYCQSHFRVM